MVPLVGTSGVTVASCLSGDEMLRVTRVPWGLSRWRGVRQLATAPTGLAATRDQATLGRPVLGHRALPPGVGRFVAGYGGTPLPWARGCD